MRDTEFLLRALALAQSSDGFSGSMTNFINNYCLRAKRFTEDEARAALENLERFFGCFSDVDSPFMRSGKFSGVLFESAYAAFEQLKRPAVQQDELARAINEAKQDEAFAETLQEGSTKPINIRARIGVLRSHIEAAM